MRLFYSPKVLSSIVLLTASCLAVQAQVQPAGKVNEIYAENCAACHGDNMEGGQAPSMLDDEWAHGGDDASLARSIHDGYPDNGMPAWSGMLSDEGIRAMVIYIREQHAKAQGGKANYAKPAESIAVESQLHTYQLKTWVGGLDDPWSLAFLPDGQAVVTEKRGRVHTIDGEKLSAPITGFPKVDSKSQAGLYDVVPHPDYANNGWLYFAYSHPQERAGRNVSLTRIIRGKIRKGAFVEQQTIFEAPADVYPREGGVHFGGRIVFDRAGYLFFTIGERGTKENAQNLAVPMGKVHRIFDDGRIPEDNPFAKQENVDRTIWSYGHRNPQGLALHPVTGELYDVEHGPRGGDEINLVLPGRNYGWPEITYGMDYSGTAISAFTAKEGMEQPVHYWVPSIAPCGANFYTGDLFPKWKNHLFVASLAAQELHRVEIADGKAKTDEVLFKGLGRIRHVIGGPDGALYVLLPERIARITPAK